jgi:hypothetical protein
MVLMAARRIARTDAASHSPASSRHTTATQLIENHKTFWLIKSSATEAPEIAAASLTAEIFCGAV